MSVKPIITKMAELFGGQWTSQVMKSLLDATPNGKLSTSVVECARPLTFPGFQALAFLMRKIITSLWTSFERLA